MSTTSGYTGERLAHCLLGHFDGFPAAIRYAKKIAERSAEFGHEYALASDILEGWSRKRDEGDE